MTLEQLQSLDAAYRFTPDGGLTYPLRGRGICVPTIQEVFSALPEMRITVEVKSVDAQECLFAAVQEYRATERVIAAGERDAYRTIFHTYAGPKSASLEEAMPFFMMHKLLLARFASVRADVVQTCEVYKGRRIVSPRLVRDFQRAGLHVHIWTVNEIGDMERLLDWGVDGIVTDRPDRLAQVLHKRYGRPLPPGLTQ
jgi:glycerophosphoryl diester phosphodiesterase